jgi:hypothetical protein
MPLGSRCRCRTGRKQSAHQAELDIAELQLRLDRDGEDADDLPVDEVEDVGEQQDREHARAAARSFGVSLQHLTPATAFSSLRAAERQAIQLLRGRLDRFAALAMAIDQKFTPSVRNTCRGLP